MIKAHPTENRMPRRATLVCRPPNSGDDRPARPPPDRVVGLTAGPRPSCLLLGQLPSELAPSFDRRALTELLQLEQLAQLHLPFGLGLTTGLKREPLGPFDGLLHRLHLEDPVAGDDLLGLAEGAVDHGALADGELDPNALGAPMERREVQEHAGLRQLVVVLAISARNSPLGRWPGSRSPLIIIITRMWCLLPVRAGLRTVSIQCEP